MIVLAATVGNAPVNGAGEGATVNCSGGAADSTPFKSWEATVKGMATSAVVKSRASRSERPLPAEIVIATDPGTRSVPGAGL